MTDTSDIAVGAVLQQFHQGNWRPIAYAKEPAKFYPTFEEASGIRYAAGWVVKELKKTLNKSPKREKDVEILISAFIDDNGDQFNESTEWVNTVDRGGLAKVNNITFQLFFAIVLERCNIVIER